MSEKIDDAFINLYVYVAMALGTCRRHPKIVLIGALLAYAVACCIHLQFYSGNKPFFTLSIIGALFIAIPLIILYKNEEKPREGRRHTILETDNDWFAERELEY